jgi:hypothetical protein
VPDSAGVALWLRGLRAFIETFFHCDAQLATKRDAVLWMWKTHNSVNARIAKVLVDP